MENHDKYNNHKTKKCEKKCIYDDKYGYDFVPELANVLNIDEQKEKAKELEDLN